MQTQELKPKETTATLSNAMDVGNPSNFIRIIELFHRQFPDLKNNLSADTITDEDTVATITKVYKESGYLLDPHGAVAYLALDKYLQQHPQEKGFILETAHPVKFPDAVEAATGETVAVPVVLKEMMTQKKEAIGISASFDALKSFLLKD
ncbi:hypothetical protein KRR40_07420 [Niabella defluvii]|nr:hypothetical protein KRR40_07420 [Niabella sp. I65]